LYGTKEREKQTEFVKVPRRHGYDAKVLTNSEARTRKTSFAAPINPGDIKSLWKHEICV